MTGKYCRNCPRYKKTDGGQGLCRMNFRLGGDRVWEILRGEVPSSCDFYVEYCMEKFNNGEKGKDFEHPERYCFGEP